MVIHPSFVVRTASIAPGVKRPESHTLTFVPGDRILWDQRTLRLYYEQRKGNFRGVLTLHGTMRTENRPHVEMELPGPTTQAQARTLVCTIAALQGKSVDEAMDHGMIVWQFNEPSSTSQPPR
ncbi:hypothetical protein A3E39_02580 [Candidatus Uhrbacteria bacterium RIFCSPHIGHO2_12_FULL_60_25]|uniref:Uncharacterized protein n=1 Tax=Candidatus Uhrbacteria bacterium RIFCSPHIGHO2_12_FULL_60_25 TaxID=1802399 RepID=A0A1F7UN39_9BACT|nr:MAG: hypothetical protein A3E39_02580 [Candidatus Uhrbacteria bacterium RIFCSPHIGHO2_12_FULL_60_25]